MNKKLFILPIILLLSLCFVRAEFQIEYGESNQFENRICYSYLLSYVNEGAIYPTWTDKASATGLGYLGMLTNPLGGYKASALNLEEPFNVVSYSFLCNSPSDWNNPADPNKPFAITNETLYISGFHNKYFNGLGLFSNDSPSTVTYEDVINCVLSQGIKRKLPYYFNHGDQVTLDLCIDYQPNQNLSGLTGNDVLEPGIHILSNGTIIYIQNPVISSGGSVNMTKIPFGLIFFDFPTAYSSGICNDKELQNTKENYNNIVTNHNTFQNVIGGWINLIQLIYVLWLIFYWLVRITVLLMGLYILIKTITWIYTKIKSELQ